MGLVPENLGPADQKDVQTLAPVIITTLRTAAAKIKKGQGKDHSMTHFGDNADAWMSALATDLLRMASVINCEDITVHGSALKKKSVGTYAAAKQPTGGWGKYTTIQSARGQGFDIRLDIKWNKAPLYRSAANPDSKFQTLVHELTHLILDTVDGSADAKEEADKWGYFVEEFR